MIGTTNKIPTVRGLSTLVRPRFGPGMLLQHDDLDLLTDYTRELNRLLFRSLFGCGVICGLEVKPNPSCGRDAITVDPGIGLVCSGDPVYVPRQEPILIDKDCAGVNDLKLWIVLCGISKSCSPRPSMCASEDDDMVSSATRERDGYEIKVVATPPKCACWCDPDAKRAATSTGAGANVTHSQRVPPKSGEAVDHSCQCVDPDDPCYEDHYNGVCGCLCDGDDGCCDCIVLARLIRKLVTDEWTIEHRVRRFIRPVLMRDPVVEREARQRAGLESSASSGGQKKQKGTSPGG
jgi:hypothetical protein